MSRHRPGGGYGHHIQRMGHDWFRLSWTFDTYVRGSRLRFPRTIQRDTDQAGAERFAKKHGAAMPVAPTPPAANSELFA